MRGIRKSWRLTGLAVVTLLLSVGCIWGLTSALASSPRPSPSSTGKVVLRLGWLADPDNLNPFIGTTSSAFTIWYMNYDSLVGLSPADLSPEKTTGLATDWTDSNGGKTWTFTLRKNAKWQDGQPVTARDVAFTFNFIIKNNATNWNSYTANVTKATAVDDYTVRFDCSAPTPALLNSFGEIPILPQHIWSKVSPSSRHEDPSQHAADHRQRAVRVRGVQEVQLPGDAGEQGLLARGSARGRHRLRAVHQRRHHGARDEVRRHRWLRRVAASADAHALAHPRYRGQTHPGQRLRRARLQLLHGRPVAG